MASYNEGKLEVIEYIMSLAPESILDVGACDGKWAQLLLAAGYAGRLDACEAFKPNAARILELYDDVFVGDIRRYEYSFGYDVIIFGDVIEHMDAEAAKDVLRYAADRAQLDVIVGVPFLYPQGELYGNPYERHIQDDLTPEIFEERYGRIGFKMFVRPRVDYAYYRMRREKMSELDKLEEYLKARGCKYDRYDSDTLWGDYSLNRHQIIVYHDGDRVWDAKCQEGSFGYEKGLLEIYGDIVWDDIDGDSVRGWLTAQDVINRIERGRDGARMDGERDE